MVPRLIREILVVKEITKIPAVNSLIFHIWHIHCFGLLYVSTPSGRDGKLAVLGNANVSLHSKMKLIQI
jgi:hypothetical protein